MRCGGLEACLTDYLDGTLDAQTGHRASAHLKRCRACSELLNEIVAATEFIRDAEGHSTSPEIKGSFRNEATAETLAA